MGFWGRAFSGLRVAGVVAGTGVLATAGVGYWFFTVQQRQYIVGRDFRVLSGLARQLDDTVQAEARVIRNLAPRPVGRGGAQALTTQWVHLRGRPYQASDIRFDTPDARAGQARGSASRTYSLRSDGRLELEVPLPGTGAEGMIAALRLQPGLDPMLASRIGQGAFEAILLGTQSGKVLLGAGRIAEQLRSSGLGVLSSTSGEPGKRAGFSDLARSVTMSDVSLAGVDYTLFLFPCCLSADGGGTPLVLAGLVRADALRSGSLAISTTVVKLAVLGLLVAMIGWPFLKLLMLGDRQQVRVSDFFQLGASSVAGLAIVTIVLLDVAAYMRINGDTDQQLRDLAGDIDAHATAEVRDAYAQLQCLERKVASLDRAIFEKATLSSVLERGDLICQPPAARASDSLRQRGGADNLLDQGPGLAWRYPFFETVAFIDRDGVQQIKLGTSRSVSNRISVRERGYFQTVVRGRGWVQSSLCEHERCALESVWSWTTGEPLAVLAKESSTEWGPPGRRRRLPVAAISFPMRSLIGPVLPPGFAFAVVDHAGKVLFHSDRQRNGNEDLFVETDNNRRLRAQIAAHSEEPLNISYWGSAYRAYLKPMTLPGLYLVALSQKERAWAINREWLVVTLIFVSVYLALWLIAALATLVGGASWVWPDAARRTGYAAVSGLCAALLGVAVITAYSGRLNALVGLGMLLPLVGWTGAYLILRHRPAKGVGGVREPLALYSVAAILLLLVAGVVPGALLFLASYELHARSYIKNSQLVVARRLSERVDRLSEAYLSTDDGKPKATMTAATQVGRLADSDIYVDFLYDTSIRSLPVRPPVPAPASPGAVGPADPAGSVAGDSDGDLVLSLLEDYLPYYSEASVEWRELLHDRAGDGSWASTERQSGPWNAETVVLTSRTGTLPVELTSWVPGIRKAPPARSEPGSARSDEGPRSDATPQPVPTTGSTEAAPVPPGPRDSSAVLLAAGLAVLGLTWGVVQVLHRRIYLTGIAEPLWACGQLAVSAGENVLVLCDNAGKASQSAGFTPLQLGPIVRDRDPAGAWRRALLALDARAEGSAVLIGDFDEGLADGRALQRKLALLDELVSDQSRTVILLLEVSLRTVADSLRHAVRVAAAVPQPLAQEGKGAPGAGEPAFERWRRILSAFVIVDRREPDAGKPLEPATLSPAGGTSSAAPSAPEITSSRGTRSWSRRFDELRQGPVVAFLLSEGRSHPYVRRVCDDLRRSDAVTHGRLTRRQAVDEVIERTAHFYRGLWASCSEDEKVVLGHIAQHGLANASVRGVVRRLLGRRLLWKDPALRPMNETFRLFVLTRECAQQVAVLETENGPSAWDRLRAPLGVAVVGSAVFLFATQKELYNAILGVTTAAAISVPTLIRAVGMLVGREVDRPGARG